MSVRNVSDDDGQREVGKRKRKCKHREDQGLLMESTAIDAGNKRVQFVGSFLIDCGVADIFKAKPAQNATSIITKVKHRWQQRLQK